MTTTTSRTILHTSAACLVADVALALVNVVILEAFDRWNFVALSLMLLAIGAVGGGVAYFTSARIGAALVVAAAVFMFNQILFMERYLTLFNAAGVAVEASVGRVVARGLALLLLTAVTVTAAQSRRRWISYAAALLLIGGSIPSKLSDAFFI